MARKNYSNDDTAEQFQFPEGFEKDLKELLLEQEEILAQDTLSSESDVQTQENVVQAETQEQEQEQAETETQTQTQPIFDDMVIDTALPEEIHKEQIDSETQTAPAPVRRTRRKSVVTIDNSSQAQPQLTPEDQSWHEVQSASRTRRLLTGTLSGIEQLENDNYIAVVYYKEIRVVIPISEMMMDLSGTAQESFAELSIRQSKIINSMLGCDIDFVVKGTDNSSRSAVASRKEAMLRKRNMFYITPDSTGQPRIMEDSIAEARIIAVTDKVVRAEIFGVETSIPARELSWDWMGNARERFDIGDKIEVKIQSIQTDGTPENIRVQASAKEATNNTVMDNLKKCRLQGKYAGKVTDVIRGNVYVRLSTGVNAIAHTCNDPRLPGKKDDVTFVVTRIDQERGIALGIITRIIRQNL